MSAWKIPPLWKGGRCFIIGGGPSVTREFGVPEDLVEKVSIGAVPPSVYSPYMEAIHNEHVIGINNVYQIGAWIDVLFFGDCTWYRVHRERLGLWPGLKVTCCPRLGNAERQKTERIKFTPKDPSHKQGINRKNNCVAWNANSGAAAISLAHHLGVKKIILLGFDMQLDPKTQYSHWHGSHGNNKPPPFKRHLRGFPVIANDAKALGLEIINASPTSEIRCFPRKSLEDILNER